MSTIEGDLLQAERQGDPPPAETQEPEQQTAVEQDTVERDVDSDVLEIPDSSVEGGKVKYVPASALAGARAELRELKDELKVAKEGSSKAQQLEARIDELSQQIAQIAPKAQAYDAAVAAQQTRTTQPAEDDTEAREFAQALDLYTAQGEPDVAKARKILGVVDKRAKTHAEQQVAPLAQHTVQSQSQVMLARAKATKAPNGQAPDPTVLEAIWSRLDPALTATPEGAKQAWAVALGYSAVMAQPAQQTTQQQPARGADGKFAKQREDIPDPLYTERAGGRDTPAAVPLSEKEKQYIKDMGMTEKDYLDAANNAPWMRRG